MGSLPTETLMEEQQQQLDLKNSSRAERAHWLLNSPDPPGLWHELIGSIREIVSPRKLSSSNTKQPWSSRCFIVLQGLFPILKWGRIYNASKFKHDLMAGLTLASLSIPQVANFVAFSLFLEQSNYSKTLYQFLMNVSKIFCRVLGMLI